MFILFGKILILFTLQSIIGVSLFKIIPIDKRLFGSYQIFAVSLGLGYLVAVLISFFLALFNMFSILTVSIVTFSFIILSNLELLKNIRRSYEIMKINLIGNLKNKNFLDFFIFIFILVFILYPVYTNIIKINYGALSTIGYTASYKELVKNRGLNSYSYMYGIESENSINKIGFILFHAYMSLFLSSDYLLLTKVYTLYFIIWLCINVLLYFTHSYDFKKSLFGLMLVVVINYFNGLFVGKFDSFRAESAGIILLFLNLFLYLKWRESKNNSIGYISILVSSMQAVTHLASFIPFCLYTGSHFLYELFTSKEIKLVKDFIFHYLAVIIVIVAILLPIGSYPEYLKGMDRSEYSDVDLTYEFRSSLSGDSSIGVGNNSRIDPFGLFSSMVTSACRSSGFRLSSTQVILYLMVVSVLGILITKQKNYETIATSLVYIFVLYLFGFVFNLIFDTWVYSTFSERRIFPYIFLTLVNLPLAVFDNQYKIKNRSKNNKIDINRLLIYGLLFTSFLYLPSYYNELSGRINSVISPHAYETLVWLSNNGGEDAVVLLNSRTTGVFSLIADCEAVFEGKATYFEPDLTRAFIELISETNDFYSKPSMCFLDKYGITHIIITEGDEVSFGGNVIDTIETSIEPLYNAVFLEEAKVFGPVHVFKVIR